MRIRLLLLLLAVGASMVRCASTARYMVAQPAIQSTKLTSDGLPDALKGRVELRCLVADGQNCIYTGVFYDHAATFASVAKKDRDALAYLVMDVANENCSWFLSRVFANRSGVTGIRDAVKNLMTGAAALTAKPSPAVSAGLGFANLFADSTVKSLDANTYANQTYDAIQSAIQTKRNTKQANILTKLDKSETEYPVGALLIDLGDYSSTCTLTAGFKSLKDVTTTSEAESAVKRKTAEEKLFKTSLPN